MGRVERVKDMVHPSQVPAFLKTNKFIPLNAFARFVNRWCLGTGSFQFLLHILPHLKFARSSEERWAWWDCCDLVTLNQMQVRDASENKQMADFMSLLLEKSPSLWNICSFFTPVSERIQFAKLTPKPGGGESIRTQPAACTAQRKGVRRRKSSKIRFRINC